MQNYGMTEDETIESKFISKSIETAQEKVEKRNFEIRKHLIEYDDVINRQREILYGLRRRILMGTDEPKEVEETVKKMYEEEIRDILNIGP